MARRLFGTPEGVPFRLRLRMMVWGSLTLPSPVENDGLGKPYPTVSGRE
jgi:hypothetical protein